ncbi:4-coumarate--CoA ligase-like 4 [Acorus gramineus]|uniref:4-coumarate--CoA ligase n=1 Tax=Acorus gramineus TaxID=55184 RepID=A0AAV9AA10_ACOGR|nr:4-coumarate--CoA ligase-like 4 [Acorus gramineus]
MEQETTQPDHRSGYCATTGTYHPLLRLDKGHQIPTHAHLDTASYVLSHFPHPDSADSHVALIDSATGHRLTYFQIYVSTRSLAVGLARALGVQKGDVVLLLSPNSLLYPTVCLAVLSVGAVLTTANPLCTASEVARQARDARAKLAITAAEEVHKLAATGVPTLLMARDGSGSLSVEELIEECDPCEAPEVRMTRSDTAALLYSSGTTGVSKGVVLTHANLIAIVTLLRWSCDVTGSRGDVYLGFLPMFHIYGLAFFALGLFCAGATTVVMPRFDFQAALRAIERYQVTVLPAVPPVILGLVKTTGCDLSMLRQVGSGAAPLSRELAMEFRRKYPWVELRQGYGLTESSGAATFFVSSRDSKERPGSVGQLIPETCARIVDVETGGCLPPGREGELWLKGPTVMSRYLGNEETTAATIVSDGWLRTGDLAYIDRDGFVYIVDRIKELIKHNGFQTVTNISLNAYLKVAPAELEAILLGHPQIRDATVIPIEDEKAGQIPMAYIVRADNEEITEDQIIKYVAKQVAPYKKVRKVEFIDVIPRSAAGKILRKQLVVKNQQPTSKL